MTRRMTGRPAPTSTALPAPASTAAPAPLSEEDRDFYRWYGAWQPLAPAEVARLLDGFGRAWWIVGGWAIEAFSGVPREHEDIDVAFLRDDLPRMLEHLGPSHCVWTNFGGMIRPLRKPDDLIDGSRQLWVREDAQHPWVMDLAMTQHDGDTWISNRDERVRLPIAEVTFEAADGIRYLRPELVLFMKAKLARPKDERDLAACLPRMSAAERGRLRSWIELVHPGHAWLERIRP